ncbi:MAG: DUF3540 domain-containing protein [Polyangiales bacterium]
MTAFTKAMVTTGALAGCVRATVLSVEEGVYSLCLATGEPARAKAVLGLPVLPAPGDAVLCIPAAVGGGRCEHVVLGVLERGVDASDAVVVSHDPASGRSVVRLPRGAVRFEAAGDLELAAAATVRLEGAHIEASARSAAVRVDRAEVHARRWELFAEIARQSAEVIETRATRVVTRAKDLFAQIEELAQTQAGRVRVVARDAVHTHARRVLLKADEDVKLRGEKIHLG